MDNLNPKENFGVQIVRPGLQIPVDIVTPKGRFFIDHYRRGKLIGKYDITNMLTTQGKNHILDVVYGNSTPVTQNATWYIGLINNSPTPTLVAGDTLASHSGWTEFTSYTGTRKAWDDANASAGVKGSNSVSTFDITTSATLYGMFICSVSSGTSGILSSQGAFNNGTIAVNNLDQLKCTYSLGF